MEHTHGKEFNQTDSLVERNRFARGVVAIFSPIIALFGGFFIGASFSLFFKLPLIFGNFAGLSIGAVIAIWMISKSFISNPAVVAFVTVDPLVTLFQNGDALVTYGPGLHICYWWETRSGGTTVDLSEAAESFDLEVKGSTGTLDLTYSVRLRPDITLLPQFLSGVASVASDVGGLISTKIIEIASKKSVDQSINDLKGLNQTLKEIFKQGAAGEHDSDFEKRFGVIIGDVTIEKILPSKEVKETLNALAEGKIISRIVAQSFGKASLRALQNAIQSGEIKQSEVDRRRIQAHALSGNPLGMDIKEQNFNLNVTGLENIDPALLQAVAAGATAFAGKKNTATQGKSKSSKGETP